VSTPVPAQVNLVEEYEFAQQWNRGTPPVTGGS